VASQQPSGLAHAQRGPAPSAPFYPLRPHRRHEQSLVELAQGNWSRLGRFGPLGA